MDRKDGRQESGLGAWTERMGYMKVGLVHGQKGCETRKWAWCMDRKDGIHESGLGAWTERMGDKKVGLVHGQKGWETRYILPIVINSRNS